MTTTTSRRAILAGGAAALATVPAVAASPRPDPIFAAIERHRATFIPHMKALKAQSEEPDFGPEHQPERHAAVQIAHGEAVDADFEAAFDLTTVVPTTMAGVLALIQYVDDFNRGKFGGDDVWRSSPFQWPSSEQFEFEADGIDDHDNELGMAYAVLLNVRDALEAMAVQS